MAIPSGCLSRIGPRVASKKTDPRSNGTSGFTAALLRARDPVPGCSLRHAQLNRRPGNREMFSHRIARRRLVMFGDCGNHELMEGVGGRANLGQRAVGIE